MNILTITSDFGVQSQGVGIMEATIFSINKEAKVIHLMHGLPSYDIVAAARTLETIKYVPNGFHVCVCDPGVGTTRKALALKVARGDYLIGPDNGVLIPAGRILGGITSAHEICNRRYMNLSISPIFHGRDIFCPAAAHLANGVQIEDIGPKLDITSLIAAPYEEAEIGDGTINATVIQINKFGSLHLNILQEEWDRWIQTRKSIILSFLNKNEMIIPVCNTFCDVRKGSNLILKDDYGRLEIAMNQGSFEEKYKVKIGTKVTIKHN